jgi:hypothetical protein
MCAPAGPPLNHLSFRMLRRLILVEFHNIIAKIQPPLTRAIMMTSTPEASGGDDLYAGYNDYNSMIPQQQMQPEMGTAAPAGAHPHLSLPRARARTRVNSSGTGVPLFHSCPAPVYHRFGLLAVRAPGGMGAGTLHGGAPPTPCQQLARPWVSLRCCCTGAQGCR